MLKKAEAHLSILQMKELEHRKKVWLPKLLGLFENKH